MTKLTLKLAIFFIFVSSCITVNYNPSVPEKKQEKVLPKKSSNIINSQPKLSEDKKQKLYKFTEKAGLALGNCLGKLVRSGYITMSEGNEFVKKVSRGLKIENALLFSSATKDDKFCIEIVPRFIDKDSYELDQALNKYWKTRGKRK